MGDKKSRPKHSLRAMIVLHVADPSSPLHEDLERAEVLAEPISRGRSSSAGASNRIDFSSPSFSSPRVDNHTCCGWKLMSQKNVGLSVVVGELRKRRKNTSRRKEVKLTEIKKMTIQFVCFFFYNLQWPPHGEEFLKPTSLWSEDEETRTNEQKNQPDSHVMKTKKTMLDKIYKCEKESWILDEEIKRKEAMLY